MHPRVILWTDLAGIDPGVLGGLVMQHAVRARAGTYAARWEKDNAIFHSISAGQEDAVRGRVPPTLVTTLPSWLIAVVRGRLRERPVPWLGTEFIEVRMLELAGLIDLEVDDDYVLSMLTGLVAEWSFERRIGGDPVKWFGQDPGLLARAYWRAFEIEGNSQASLRVGGGHQDGSDWHSATLGLIDAGMVPRERVIDACLAAVTGDLSPTAARWHSTTLTALKVTVAELAARQPTVRRLLGSDAPATLTLGLRWIRQLDQAGLLDDLPTADALRPAVTAQTKTAALAALKQLDVVRRRSPTADIATPARAGLGHPHADVQRAAAHLLVACGAEDLLHADAELLEPSIRREFGLLAEDSVTLPTPVPFDLPVLRPVTDRDLTERLAALMEQPNQPVELELVLDRLARGGASEDLRPLTKRALGLLKSGPGDWDGRGWLAGQIARLVVLATTDRRPAAPLPDGRGSQFLHQRLLEVEEVLTGRRAPGPLLATPTEASGWVDAAALVARLATQPTPPRRDLLAAILRLSPEGRVVARKAWERTEGGDDQLRLALRHALGEAGAQSSDVRDRALWVAASRARGPLDPDDVLVRARLGAAGQGRGLDCTARFTLDIQKHTWGGEVLSTDRSAEYVIDIAHAPSFETSPPPRVLARLAGSRRPDPDQPTAVRGRTSHHHDPERESWPTWLSILWPHDAEHFMLGAIDTLHWAGRGSPGVLMPEFSDLYRTLVHHPGRLGPLTFAGLALGLNSGGVEGRLCAVDTLLSLEAQGRVGAEDIAHGLTTTAESAVLTRWADSLRALAAAGSPHLVIATLTYVLPHLSRDRRGLHTLLDVLHQEHLRASLSVHDPSLRDFLQALTGTSKAARSARAILAL